MGRYRKVPVEIEANRLDRGNIDNIRYWIADHGGASYPAFNGSGLVLPTLEGDMIANWGDWVIKGIQGEFYPCKPDIFAETYVSAEEEEEK